MSTIAACIFAIGAFTGSVMTGFIGIPLARRRWQRTLDETQADIVRINAGLAVAYSVGRHSAEAPPVPVDTTPTVELRLDDADGAYAQASTAHTPSPYPGNVRKPAPEWTAWVGGFNELPTRWTRLRDRLRRRVFKASFVALAVVWRLGVAVRRVSADIQFALEPQLIPGIKQ